jgi:Pyruvate/2-oxoacid:ferredoxin oxidoreductase gamma subunit
MGSLLNQQRPPVFCPGCAHERVVQALDKALGNLGLEGRQVALVSDIGCSGLFDTFFDTHALHGLHGRALTYATGIKMARPDLKVVVTMGDGGLGIGGAHLLSTCRRNIDLTLLVLNNFNYGMTGGQCSSTTPPDALMASGFLNQLEKPVDVCRVAGAAGAPHLARLSTYDPDLVPGIEKALRYDGFSLVDIWGICPGRYTRRNKLTPKMIAGLLADLPPAETLAEGNARPEYGESYRAAACRMEPLQAPKSIGAQFAAPRSGRLEVVILGSAGQRIVTAGELLGLAGITAGLHASQKNDYPITVLRGHSVSELILSRAAIGYTGIEDPAVVIALAQEGVERRRGLFSQLRENALVIKSSAVSLPPCDAEVRAVDFKALKIKSQDWALAALAMVAQTSRVITVEMLRAAVGHRFDGAVRQSVESVLQTVAAHGESATPY